MCAASQSLSDGSRRERAIQVLGATAPAPAEDALPNHAPTVHIVSSTSCPRAFRRCFAPLAERPNSTSILAGMDALFALQCLSRDSGESREVVLAKKELQVSDERIKGLEESMRSRAEVQELMEAEQQQMLRQ